MYETTFTFPEKQSNGTSKPTSLVGPDDIITRWELVTPEKAEAWLAKNTQNRNPNPGKVNRLARRMDDEVFHVNHQGMAFDVKGVMIDGQNRCLAVVKSGRPQWFLISYGLKKIARAVTDTGDSRKTRDQIQIIGGEKENAARIAMILSRIRAAVDGTTQRMEWEEVVAERKKYAAGLEWAVSAPHHVRFSSAPVMGAMVYAYPTNPSVVQKAHKDLVDGTGLEARDPIITLRDTVLSMDKLGVRRSNDVFDRTLTALWHRAMGRKANLLRASQGAAEYFGKAY